MSAENGLVVIPKESFLPVIIEKPKIEEDAWARLFCSFQIGPDDLNAPITIIMTTDELEYYRTQLAIIAQMNRYIDTRTHVPKLLTSETVNS